MNEFKTKIIILIAILLAAILLFLSLYKITDYVNVSIYNSNDCHYIYSTEQINIGNHVAKIGQDQYSIYIKHIYSSSKLFVYEIKFNDNIEFNNITKLSIVNGKISVLKYIINFFEKML